MRRWESVLRRDTQAWDDFKTWLHELERTEQTMMMNEANADGILQAKGRVFGIQRVFLVATANEREEQARARSGVQGER
jgi:hypothetical protein